MSFILPCAISAIIATDWNSRYHGNDRQLKFHSSIAAVKHGFTITAAKVCNVHVKKESGRTVFYVKLYKNTYIHTYIHMYIHTHVHTNTYYIHT